MTNSATHLQHVSRLVALGASAGGPAAVGRILARLPGDFPASVVVIQHVDSQFTQGLANWLAHQTPLRVRLARAGDCPEAGTVLLAARDSHLVFSSPEHLAYTDHPDDCSYRPSIDVFFKSAVRCWAGEIIGVLLTGMGRDGAEGLSLLRSRGHFTIAQDQASSAVYGMPKAAALLRAATRVLSLDEIAPCLLGLCFNKTIETARERFSRPAFAGKAEPARMLNPRRLKPGLQTQ